MDNLATMHILESHSDLNEPVEDFRLSERAFLLHLLLDVEGEITNTTIFHDNDQRVVSQEAFFVCDNIRMI